MRAHTKLFRSVSLVVIIAFLSLMTASCGGSGGTSSTGNSGGGANSAGNDSLENTVMTKAQNILPPDEYAIFIGDIQKLRYDPNYDNYLTELDQSIDKFNAAYEKFVAINKGTKRVKSSSTNSGPESAIEKVKAVYSDMFGALTDKNAQSRFLNAGMGFGQGLLGGIKGQVALGHIVAGTAYMSSGLGMETDYDFLNFQQYSHQVSECSSGVGIGIGEGAGATANVTGVYFQNWIFGNEKGEIPSGGSSKGTSVGLELGGHIMLGFGLGIDSTGWRDTGGSCNLTDLLNPLSCTSSYGLDSQERYGISYAIGASIGVGVEVEASGTLNGSSSVSCSGSPSTVVDYLDLSNVRDLPAEFRYKVAGLRMATDILSSGTGFTLDLSKLAAATAVLYGMYYGDALIGGPTDSTKPQVNIISPTEGSIVPQGNVAVTVSATDDSGIYEMKVWLLDRDWIGNDMQGFSGYNKNETYTFTWNTSNITAGTTETIVARATDTSGNYSDTYVNVTIGTPSGYSISGKVTDSTGAPLSGVTVSLTGAGTAAATTKTDGSYKFAGLQNGEYTVTPSLTNYTFKPQSEPVKVNGADVTAQGFVGTQTGNTASSFYDDFSGDLSNWVLFGSPQPVLVSSVFGRNGVFDNNGDSNSPSGAISKDLIECSNGCTIESDVYLDFSNLSGCWTAASIGMTRAPYANGAGYSDQISEYGDGLYFAIAADGDACWMTPAAYREHAHFWLGIYADDGTMETLPATGSNLPADWYGTDWTTSINADQFANGWHTLKIEIGADGTVKFSIDDNLLWQPTKKLNPTVLEGRNIVLGARSSGSAGKAYHDWVRVEQ